MKKLIMVGLLSTFGLVGCGDEPAPVENKPAVEVPPAEQSRLYFGYWKDEMTDKTTYYTMLESVNSHDFAWPHDKNTKAYLYVVSDGTVRVRLSSGQVICPSYTLCAVPVKFDDTLDYWLGMGFDNGRYDGFFFCRSPADNCKSRDLINKIKKTKTLKVQVEVYQHGNPVFEFDTSEYEDHPMIASTAKK